MPSFASNTGDFINVPRATREDMMPRIARRSRKLKQEMHVEPENYGADAQPGLTKTKFTFKH